MELQQDKHEGLMKDLEERANQLLEEILDLNDAEIDVIYSAAHSCLKSRQRVLELAERAAAVCEAERRSRPPQLEAALTMLAQLDLPLDAGRSPVPLRGLLIDQDADRLMVRRKLFLERHVDIAITTSVFDGLEKLESEAFDLVVVDYCPSTEKERVVLLSLQRFNLRVPMINIGVWAGVLRPENRQLNRDLLRVATRLFGKPVPKRLPKKRPPKTAKERPDEQTLFNVG